MTRPHFIPDRRPGLILKPGKEKSLLRHHLWLFSGAVDRVEGEPNDGDLIHVVSSAGEWIAVGHYQRTGSIRCRVLSFRKGEDGDKTALPEEILFWEGRIGEAAALRKELGWIDGEQTDCCRLIHGEGDRLPGLIIDLYNGVAVVQFHSLGMFRQQDVICRALEAAMDSLDVPLRGLYIKTERGVHLRGDEGLREGWIVEGEGQIEVKENGLKYRVDVEEGQKTGFFLDQRDNRALVREFSKGKKVCNLFAYTGGFSVSALAGGAVSVDSVEVSSTAVDLLEENIALNFKGEVPHRSFRQDAFEFFTLAPERYQLIVLDPPAFAKHREAIPNALKGYRSLNRSAFRNIAPGGILFTFSCSQLVTPEMFREAVFSAAAHAGREVRILHTLTQGADHPVNLFHPEGEYLKGLVLQVV